MQGRLLTLGLLSCLLNFNRGIAGGLAGPCTNATCTLTTDILLQRTYYIPDKYHHAGNREPTIYLKEAGQTYRYTENEGVDFIASAISSSSPYYNDCAEGGKATPHCDFKSAELKTNGGYWSTQGNNPQGIPIKHGYLVVRAQMPQCETQIDGKTIPCSIPMSTNLNKGVWPAIWLMPVPYHPWPKGGEIDLLEYVPGRMALGHAASTIHYLNAAGHHVADSVGDLPEKSQKDPLPDAAHDFGLEWNIVSKPQPQVTLTGYFDGVVQWSKTYGKGSDGYTNLITDSGFNFYLIVNNLIGGSFPGSVAPGLKQTTLHIESIKFYTVGAPTS